MLDIKIGEELKQKCPQAALGCLKAQVIVKPGSEQLKEKMLQTVEKVKLQYSVAEITALAPIKHSREAYKQLGKDPSRYRLSSEALLRRVLQGKGLYRINNVVDINNLMSLASFYSIGSYDLACLKEKVIFTYGKPGQTYKGIGKQQVNLENLPVFVDEKGPFGSPTSDSERGMVTERTSHLLLCMISFNGSNGLQEHLRKTEKLLEEYAAGNQISTQIIE